MGPELLIPLAGMVTGVISIAAIAFAGIRIFNGPVGQALGRRLQGRGGDPEMIGELMEVRQQLEQVQQRLADAEERLDFSERLLAQKSESADRSR
jgi:hypothetical protein